MSARTKLVCTLGPASATPKMVRGSSKPAPRSSDQLLARHAGGPRPERLDRARGGGVTGRSLSILADLPAEGPPRGRVSRPVRVPGRPVVRDPTRGARRRDGSKQPHPARGRPPGRRPDPARGRRRGARSPEPRATACRPSACARLGPQQGVNVPAERLSLPPVTERDREMLRHVLDLGVDLVAQSFVRVPPTSGSSARRWGSAPSDRGQDRDPSGRGRLRADPRCRGRGDGGPRGSGVELPMEEIPSCRSDCSGQPGSPTNR